MWEPMETAPRDGRPFLARDRQAESKFGERVFISRFGVIGRDAQGWEVMGFVNPNVIEGSKLLKHRDPDGWQELPDP